MINNSKSEPNKIYNKTFQLDSYLEESEWQNEKNLRERASTTDENLPNEKRISFEEVISSNLSNIYHNICQEPKNVENQSKIRFQNEVQNKEQLQKEEKDKCFLPVESKLENENCQRQGTRKPSLKSEKVKSQRDSDDKINQKENSEIGHATQKHVRIKSDNVIKYFPDDEKQSTQPEERNPETSFQNAEKLLTDLSREFQYVGDFSLIRKQVIELAISKNLTIMQNTSEFVTIKASSKIDYCHCLIKSCFNMEETGGIFQLKNSIYKRNKAKFILISGNQRGYLKFFRSMLIKLWNLKSLKLKKNELVQFFVNVEKDDPSMKELKKQYTKLYNQFSGVSGETKLYTKSASQSLIASLKDNFNRLKNSQKRNSISLGDRFKQVLEYSQKVNAKFTELRRKLFSLAETLDSDLEKQLQTEIYYHEFPVWKLFGFFYKTQFENYISKRQEIITNYTLRKIFLFLEIQEQYSLFLVQKGRLHIKNEPSAERQKVKSCQTFQKGQNQHQDPSNPYQECIKTIESMSSCPLIPSKFLQKVEIFYKQLQSSYSQLYAQKPVVKISSMDDELPVTIFILLMAELNEFRSTSLNILGKIKWLLKWIEHQENNRDAQFDKNKPYNQIQEGFALSKKMLTTLEAAFVFVTNQWKEHEDKNKNASEEEKKESDQKE